MIETLIKSHYGFTVSECKKLSVGAGSNTYVVMTDHGKFILKNPNKSEANNPESEPKLCNFLRTQGIPTSEFIKNNQGEYVWYDNNGIYHMQRFVEGENYPLNTAPDWLMAQSAQMLGRIHKALLEYAPLPTGIGEDFFRHMTPESVLKSYEISLKAAISINDAEIIDDINFRISLLKRFSVPDLNINNFTRLNTHGDYFISQLICGDSCINAVIDWTSACIHPIVWEIIRSFAYGDISCINGELNINKLIAYVRSYLNFAALTEYDIKMMPYLFYYQIAVCDYYNQYYKSTASNRHIYLQQALFSTKLMRWLDKNVDTLSEALFVEFN